jgi:hypothetical protein
MFYLIYKTTNLINEKYYIGCHKTSNLEDGYLGSGKALLESIEKYGKDNFSREILAYCDSEDHMYETEKGIVNEEVVNDRNSYNLKIGGSSNFYYVNKNGLNHSSNQHLKHAEKLKNDKEYAAQFSEKMSKAMKKKPYVRTEKQKESARLLMMKINERKKSKGP